MIDSEDMQLKGDDDFSLYVNIVIGKKENVSSSSLIDYLIDIERVINLVS